MRQVARWRPLLRGSGGVEGGVGSIAHKGYHGLTGSGCGEAMPHAHSTVMEGPLRAPQSTSERGEVAWVNIPVRESTGGDRRSTTVKTNAKGCWTHAPQVATGRQPAPHSFPREERALGP